MQRAPKDIASSEWRENWLVLAAATICCGAATVHFLTIGLFTAPLQSEFGWSRGAVMASQAIVAVGTLLGGPISGAVIDRVGPGRIAPLAVSLYVAALAGIALSSSTIASWWIAWTVMAVASLFVKPILWTLTVAKRFDRSRGLAIGVVMCGPALFTIFIPSLTQWIIASSGWRTAYISLAALTYAIMLPVTLFALGRTPGAGHSLAEPERSARRETGGGSLGSGTGSTFRQILRKRQFWQLLISALLAGLCLIGLQIHLVPILTERHFSPAAAAGLVGASGASAVVGRLGGGYLLDRWPGASVGAGMFLIAAVASIMLRFTEGHEGVPVVAVLLLGLAYGAEVDVLSYLTTRYFGLRAYGSVFGTIAGVMGFGGGVGPMAAGMAYDALQTYDTVVLVCGLGLFVTAILIGTLGPYPGRADFEFHM
jgi:predicted MFS family arabinose efflux permease